MSDKTNSGALAPLENLASARPDVVLLGVLLYVERGRGRCAELDDRAVETTLDLMEHTRRTPRRYDRAAYRDAARVARDLAGAPIADAATFVAASLSREQIRTKEGDKS